MLAMSYAIRFAPGHDMGAIRARVAVEQASTFGWERFVGVDGAVVGMTTFGASAPIKALQKHFGFEPDRVAAVAKSVLTALRSGAKA